MAAESLYEPIPRELIRQARGRLAYDGLSVEDWARREGFEPKTVYNVLSGRRMAIRGKSLRIAIKLGLRSAPDDPHGAAPADESPAGRTLAGGAPISEGNRRPIIQQPLGEPVR